MANRFLPETCHNCYLNVSTVLTKYSEVHDIEAVTRSSVTLTKPSSWLGSQSRVVSFHSTGFEVLAQSFCLIRHEEWKRLRDTSACSSWFPLVLAYAVSFLMTDSILFFRLDL